MAVSIKRLRRGHSILRVKRIITATVLATATTVSSFAGIASAGTNASETVYTTTRNSFVPYDVTVTEGQSVRFADGSFGGTHELRIGDELVVPPSSGWDVTRTFPTAGTFIFYCSLHGTPEAGMRGTVTVTPVGPTPTTPTNTTPTPPPTPPPPLPPL